VAHPPTCRGAFLEDGPFAEFEDLYQRMGQLLDGAFGGGQPAVQAWAPHADLSETDQAYVAEIEPPGVARDDISVELPVRNWPPAASSWTPAPARTAGRCAAAAARAGSSTGSCCPATPKRTRSPRPWPTGS
jgi:hypothetical protein